MKFTFDHNNINVLNLEKSLAFYRDALGLTELRRKETADFILVFLGGGGSSHKLELTWLKARTEPYDLGEGEFHLAFVTDEYASALQKHREMGCVCMENDGMGIYFIEDPDGYWIEIVPCK